MYDKKTINRVISLLEKYNFQITKVAHETGIKVRTVTEWKTKYLKGIPINNKVSFTRKCKWSKEERAQVIEYYFNHGCNASMTVRIFGYPACSTFKEWLKKDKRFKQKNKINKKVVKLSREQQESAVVDLALRKQTISEIAHKYDITRETLYGIAKRLTGEKIGTIKSDKDCNPNDLKKSHNSLKEENKRLLIENKILRKANEILKKEMGDDYSSLTNKEKTQIVIALKNEYKVSDILPIINLKKSTYFYEIKSLSKDKYKIEKNLIIQLFHDNYECYGYRRIKASLFQEYGIKISEKVVRKLMKELKLFVYVPKKAKYSSYKGEISPESENVIKRDFKANEPYSKSLTDITEFSLCDGKVYLSPLIDCFTGVPITYTIGKSPNTELTNTMLDNAHKIVGNTNMIIHSDRGFHYRLDSWISRMSNYGYIRSMSKKGCSPDNSACEGFFGTLKSEFYYPRDWRFITTDQFIIELEKYLDWFCDKRIKKRLNYLNSNEYVINYFKQVQ